MHGKHMVLCACLVTSFRRGTGGMKGPLHMTLLIKQAVHLNWHWENSWDLQLLLTPDHVLRSQILSHILVHMHEPERPWFFSPKGDGNSFGVSEILMEVENPFLANLGHADCYAACSPG